VLLCNLDSLPKGNYETNEPDIARKTAGNCSKCMGATDNPASFRFTPHDFTVTSCHGEFSPIRIET
jgi:hypothetical protein